MRWFRSICSVKYHRGIQPHGWETGIIYHTLVFLSWNTLVYVMLFRIQGDRSTRNLVWYSRNALSTLWLNASKDGFRPFQKGVKWPAVWHNRYQPSFAKLWQEGFSLKMFHGATFGWIVVSDNRFSWSNCFATGWSICYYFPNGPLDSRESSKPVRRSSTFGWA